MSVLQRVLTHTTTVSAMVANMNKQLITMIDNDKMDRAEHGMTKWFFVILIFIAAISFLSNEIHRLELENAQLKNPTFATKLDSLHNYMRASETKRAWKKAYCK